MELYEWMTQMLLFSYNKIDWKNAGELVGPVIGFSHSSHMNVTFRVYFARLENSEIDIKRPAQPGLKRTQPCQENR